MFKSLGQSMGLNYLKSKASIEFWVVLCLFITGFCIRLYRLGDTSLEYDEIFTAIRIDHSFLNTICLLGNSAFPPLHYVILNLWVHVFGNGEWALRFPSVIFSSLTIIVIYKLGKELFSKEVGFIAASLLVFSPFAIGYAQDAKMYALFWFLEAVSFLFFFRFLKDQRGSSYGFYIIASVLCCYTIYTGFLFLVTQSIIFLLMGERTQLRKWFRGQLIIVFLYIPWIVFFLCSKHEFPDAWLPGAAVNSFSCLGKALLLIISSYRGKTITSAVASWGAKANCFLYIFLITLFLTDVLTAFYKNKKMRIPALTGRYYLFLWATILTFIYCMSNYFFIHMEFESRYVGFLQLPIILIVSSQINDLHRLIKRILVLILLVIAMSNICLYFKDYIKYPPRIAGDVVVSGFAARIEGIGFSV